MSVSEQHYTLLHITLTIDTSVSNSGNVSMPIKFDFLINLFIQTIFKYVCRLCINNNVRKTVYNAFGLITFYIYKPICGVKNKQIEMD